MKKAKKNQRPEDIGEIFIIRKVRGQLQLIRRPRTKPKRPTAKQIRMRNRFKLATEYASQVAADQEAASLYVPRITSRYPTVRMVALRDFMNPPVIHSATLASDHIRIHVTDDFMVTQVKVKIIDKNKRMVAEGEAVRDTRYDAWWNFSMSPKVAALSNFFVKIEARDRPGNWVELVVQFPEVLPHTSRKVG
jgi:hypothetical protein